MDTITGMQFVKDKIFIFDKSGEIAQYSEDNYSLDEVGFSWSDSSDGLLPTGNNVKSLIVIGTFLFAGTYGGGVYKSVDYGATWVAVNTGLSNLNVYSLVAISTTIYAATDGGVFKTTNYGTSWSVVNTGLTSTDTRSITAIGTDLYVGTFTNGMFKSTNGGTSWSAINTGISDLAITAVFNDGTYLYCGTNYGIVYQSIDNGANWSDIGWTGATTTVSCFLKDGTNIYVGYRDRGVYFSDDGGTTWNPRNTGMSVTDVMALFSDGTYFYVGTWGGGVYRTSDNGITWGAFNAGLTSVYALTFALYGTLLFSGSALTGVCVRDLAVAGKIVKKLDTNYVLTDNLGVRITKMNLMFESDGSLEVTVENGTDSKTMVKPQKDKQSLIEHRIPKDLLGRKTKVKLKLYSIADSIVIHGLGFGTNRSTNKRNLKE